MVCSICNSLAQSYCSAKVIGKYDVQYYKCVHCQFIFTEEPFWLSEAYDSAITKLDIGLITRNEYMVPVVQAVINKWFNPDAKFIDYGGGYGMLVRMMRDRGYDFYRQDIYCANLYAESFDITDVPPFKAEILTAFEVFEHLSNPLVELKKMLELSNSILFSTTVQPNEDVNPATWWYFMPETGQHIALFSQKSLRMLAGQFGLYYNWNEQNVHFFSPKKIDNRLFKIITHPRWGRYYNTLIGDRPGFLSKDYSYIQSKINTSSY